MAIGSAASFVPRPDKRRLLDAYVGKSIQELPTPSVIVDVARVRRNCARMLKSANELGLGFRAHVKTHKTLEGTLHMLSPDLVDSRMYAGRTIVSTTQEAWGLIEENQANLSEDREKMKGILDDVRLIFQLPLIHSNSSTDSPSD